LVGLSGDEFLRRWHAADYASTADDPEQDNVMHLAILIPIWPLAAAAALAIVDSASARVIRL
jgi:hypothetical protein